MENGQQKTAIEAIPLLHLPSSTPDTLNSRASTPYDAEELSLSEVVTKSENDKTKEITKTEDDSSTESQGEDPTEDPRAAELREAGISPIEFELRVAVGMRDVIHVEHLLAAGASLTCRGYADIPLLHYCIRVCYRKYKVPRTYCLPAEFEILQALLAAAEKAENKSDILNGFDKYGCSPLYLAIDFGYFEAVQELVKSGVNLVNISARKETALHVAVKHPNILKYFLEHHDIDNSVDANGYNAMHAAAKFDKIDSLNSLIRTFGILPLTDRTDDGSTVLHIAAENGFTKIVDILNQLHDKWISFRDDNGETALIRSIRHGHKAFANMLLDNGAILSDKGYNGKTAVEQIARNFSDPLRFFEDVFDKCITECDSTDTKERKVGVDYKVLTKFYDEGMSQIKVIEELVRCGQSELLLHPLIESLLFLKWKCLLPVFYTIIAIYAIFLVSFNTFLVTTFVRTDNDAINCSIPLNEANTQCHECFDVYDWMWIVLIYLSIILLLGQECVYVYLQRRRYFKHLESWVKLCLLALAAVVPPGVICGDPAPWLRHVSCAALLLSWLQAMFLLSRFPHWGYYVLMFERVAYNIFKVLLTSICLVIAFSFCFMIQYQSEAPFDGPQAAFVKTLVMMSSEFDYEDLFANDHNALAHTKSVVRLLFVVFVIFIAIVLMNFMIGIAVSDISELNKIGNIRRLEKQVEIQSTLDVLVDTVLVKIFKKLKRIKFHYSISKNIESDEKWKVCYAGYEIDDDYEQCLTTDLQNAIINVAKRKEQRNKDDDKRNEKKNKMDVMYNALLKLPKDFNTFEESFNRNTEAFILEMQNKISSLEISNKEMKQSMDELKANVNNILSALVKGTTFRKKRKKTKIYGNKGLRNEPKI